MRNRASSMYAKIYLFALALAFFVPAVSFAQGPDLMGLEETTIPMSIPSDNILPWAFVEGTVASHADGQPVIIQIYKDGKPVQFAQVPVSDDGTYQYRFRALDVTDGKMTRIFDGDYTVKIFKVVNLDSEYLDSYLKDFQSSLVSVF